MLTAAVEKPQRETSSASLMALAGNLGAVVAHQDRKNMPDLTRND